MSTLTTLYMTISDVSRIRFLNILFIFSKGKLERTAVLKAVCSGFKETTEPSVCLSGG